MLLFFLKQVINAMQPLCLLWYGLLAFWIWLRRQPDASKAARWCSLLWGFMTITCCLPVGNRCLASLENGWRGINTLWTSLPQADAIVCLGGGVQPTRQEIIGLNLGESSDRPTTAIELLRQNKAPLLVIGGGDSPGQKVEADAVKDWIERWQLTTAKVESLGICADTHDESQKVAALARSRGWKRILLVTSASHMSRAAAVFRKSTGIEIVPVPCSFITNRWPTDWAHLPDAHEFDAFGNWFHETIGWFSYKLRGWI